MAGDLQSRIIAGRRQMNQQLPEATTKQKIGAFLGGMGGFTPAQNPVLAKRAKQQERLDAQHDTLMKAAKAAVPLQVQAVKDLAEDMSQSGRFRSAEEFRTWFMADAEEGGFGGRERIDDIALDIALSKPEMSDEAARVAARQMIEPALQSFVSPTEAGTAEGRKETAKAEAITGRSLDETERLELAGIEGARPQSPLGKLLFDRQSAVKAFGQDSPQAKAFDEAIESQQDTASGVEPPKLTDIRGVRQEYTKASGEFVAAQNAYGRILATPDTAAGDVALVFNFMKMLDPGSVVREGEFAVAAAAAGLDDRLVQLAARVDNGERLTTEQRADFRLVADRTFRTQMETQKLTEQTFRNLAIRLGMDPNKVVIPFIRQDFADTAPVERQQTAVLDTSSPESIAQADIEALRNYVTTASAEELDALPKAVSDAILARLK